MTDIPLGGAALILRTDDRQLDQGISRARRKAIGLSNDFKRVGRSITTSLTLPILGVGAAMAKVSLSFESSLSQIVGLVGVADEQVQQWREDILKLGPAVGKGPEELAEAMFFITSAGLRGAQAMEALTLSAKAASAGLGETKVVADAVTSAMNAYGAEVVSAASATNSLVGAVREGKAGADTIAGSLGRVIPLAAEMGVRFDQVSASIAALTRLGSGAEETVTSLNSLMLGLKAPTQQAEAALNGMGLASADLRKQIREGGLLDVLFQLKEKFDESDTAATKVFPNIRALKAALGLLGKNADITRAIFDSLANTTTFLDDAFSAAAETGRFRLASSMARIKNASIAIGDVIVTSVLPMFEKFAIFIERVGIAFRALAPALQSTIVKMVLMVAVAGPLLLLVSGLISIFGALLSPVVLVGAAIALFVFGVIQNLDALKAFMADFISNAVLVWNKFLTATESLRDGIKTIIVDKIAPIFKWLTDKLIAFKNKFFELVKVMSLGKVDLSALQDSVITGFKDAADGATAIVVDLKDTITNKFVEIKDDIKDTVAALVENTTESFRKMVSGINTATGKIDPPPVSAWREGILQLSELLRLFADSVGTVFEVMVDGSQRMAETKRANAAALTETTTKNAEAVADVTESNADALARVEERNAEALARVGTSNADATAKIRARNAKNITDIMVSNAADLADVQELNTEALNNVIEGNADAISNIKKGNVDAIKGIIISVISLLQGMIVASAAANAAISVAWIPGSIGGIIAALAALEGAKALVRNVKFAQGGIATPQGALITANNATANVAEAGRSEAFLPLTRMDNGDLGVASGGGGVGNKIELTIQVSQSTISNKQSIDELIIQPVIEAFRSQRIQLGTD